MQKILEELKSRDLPYTVTEIENGSVILYAMGYAPFLYHADEFEIDAFYLTSNRVYALSRELAMLKEGAIPSPYLNYKKLAEESGLGVRGKNDLIFSPEFGSLMSIGAVFIEGEGLTLKREVDALPCVTCGKCVKACPTFALDGGFERKSCIRDQMDNGIKDETLKLLGKSILGCNICSINCPHNKAERVRPPEEFADIVKADNFFKLCLEGKRSLKTLGEYIGTNYIRPARFLTLAVLSINNVECDRRKWLNALADYPDERVRRVVNKMSPFVKD